jgi:tetratricopeptide (TPR) repeat protein
MIEIIGRSNERSFLFQHLIEADKPAYTLVSVSGPAGVGKSTFLRHFQNEVHISRFKDSCLMALIDEHLAAPVQIMEQCAVQFRMAGYPLATFETALTRVKKEEQKRHWGQEMARSAFAHFVTDLSRANIRGIPVIGGFYEATPQADSMFLQSPSRSFEPAISAKGPDTPIGELTRAFVEDLNWLTTASVTVSSQHNGRGRRVILLLDGIEPSTTETTDWLLQHVLQAALSQQIVFIVAGREAIAFLALPQQALAALPLAPFTEDETRSYLAARGITGVEQVARFWQLSGGLPLSLNLLAMNPQVTIDPNLDLATTIVRSLSELSSLKQQLVLHAALFSHAFQQDDLAVFPFVPEHERTGAYRWLIALPFVQHCPVNGRHRFHPLAQDIFNQIFLQRSARGYYAARHALTSYYRCQLDRLLAQREVQTMPALSDQWLELAQALAMQFGSLPDEASAMSAVDSIITMAHSASQSMSLVPLAQELCRKHDQSQAESSARRMLDMLCRYLETDRASEEWIVAVTDLLETVKHSSRFSPSLLASLYKDRGKASFVCEAYPQAGEDFQKAVALVPPSEEAHILQGMPFYARGEYQQARAAFDQALQLNAQNALAYAYRALTLYRMRDNERALADIERALFLEPSLDGLALLRSIVYEKFIERARGLGSFDQAIAANATDAQAYVMRGLAMCALGAYERAIQCLDRAVALNPNEAQVYAARGHVLLEMGQIEQARADLRRSSERNADDIDTGLLLEWIALSQSERDAEMPARLERLASVDPQQHATSVCRGMALILRDRYEEAIAELDQALLLTPGAGDALFWKCLACAFLGRDQEAAVALKQAKSAGVPLPEVLFTPLRWLEQKNPEFYRMHVVPLIDNPER